MLVWHNNNQQPLGATIQSVSNTDAGKQALKQLCFHSMLEQHNEVALLACKPSGSYLSASHLLHFRSELGYVKA